MLERDMMRRALMETKQAYFGLEREHNRRLAATIIYMMRAAIKSAPRIVGHDLVIIGDCNVEHKAFWQLASAVPNRQDIELVYFDVPADELRRRNKSRPEDDRVPEDRLEEYIELALSPQAWFKNQRNYPMIRP